jgi:non-heme Fe2+,alpha-ketoglutarate-dependent halogenase
METLEQDVAVERWLIGVCRELNVNASDAESDFFEVGGTSLTAIRLLARVDEEFGEHALSSDDLFERSRIREIAATIRLNIR